MNVNQVSKAPFKCTVQCKTAVCCNTGFTRSIITIGDLWRIADHKRIPLPIAWQRYAMVNAVPLKDENNRPSYSFEMNLGLLRFPRCVFLNDEFKCDAYDARPIGCAIFPPEESFKSSSFGEFVCMEGAHLTKEQLALRRSLNKIYEQERQKDEETFWWKGLIDENGRLLDRIRSIESYDNFQSVWGFAAYGMDRLSEDEFPAMGKLKKLYESASIKVGMFKEQLEASGISGPAYFDSTKDPDSPPYLSLDVNLLAFYLGPVFHFILARIISDKLLALDQKTLDFYRETSRQYDAILNDMGQ